MNLRKLVGKDIWARLRGLTLDGWNQYWIIGDTQRPLWQKRAAYEVLMAETKDDPELTRVLAHEIETIDEATRLSEREAAKGYVFRACSQIYTVDIHKVILSEHSDTAGYFSSYRTAAQWLAAQRDEARAGGRQILTYQYIEEKTLDTNNETGTWHLDEYGWMLRYNPKIYETSFTFKSPDDVKYIRILDVFAPGDILVGSEMLWPRFIHMDGGYAVVPYGRDGLSKAKYEEEYGNVPLLCYAQEEGTVSLGHYTMWELERFHGKLPEEHALLHDISRHFKGEKLLDGSQIKRLDPEGHFIWHQV